MTLILLIDHDDSFTYNMKQLLQEIDESVIVQKPDTLTTKQVASINPKAIILSSGPKKFLNDQGTHTIIETFKHEIPILGIGLGHLIIAKHFGASIIPVQTIEHGKTASIKHDGSGIFGYLEQPQEVMRYYSFTIDETTQPDELITTAHILDNGEIMAFRHTTYHIYGLQFQPDSIGTPNGKKMIQNFLTEIQKGDA